MLTIHPTAIRCLHDNLLVLMDDVDKVTDTGIHLPDAACDYPMTGRVVSAGPGKHSDKGTLVEMTVEDGQRVIFGRYQGIEVKLDGESHKLLKQDQILGVIADDAAIGI